MAYHLVTKTCIYIEASFVVNCHFTVIVIKKTSYERPIKEDHGYIGRIKELEVFQVVMPHRIDVYIYYKKILLCQMARVKRLKFN